MPGLNSMPVARLAIKTTMFSIAMLSRSPQIRDMNFRDTTAPFTVSADHKASLSSANLPADSAFYGVSVRRLIALLQASFRHRLAALPLPFTSRCCSERVEAGGHRQGTCTPSVHTHAGRTLVRAGDGCAGGAHVFCTECKRLSFD